MVTPQKPVPDDWLQPLEEREILCLAGGGGQQAPILAAAGARVTVFDFSPAQLQRDREIADRQQIEIETVEGDMRDLSRFPPERFDLILNPCSICYCPEIMPIWQEAYRVLKPGGQLISGLLNPTNYLFDHRMRDRGELIVRNKIPYCEDDKLDSGLSDASEVSGPLEFGHSLCRLIGGQIEVGFAIIGFYEDTWGGRDKLSEYIDVFFATRAVRTR